MLSEKLTVFFGRRRPIASCRLAFGVAPLPPKLSCASLSPCSAASISTGGKLTA